MKPMNLSSIIGDMRNSNGGGEVAMAYSSHVGTPLSSWTSPSLPTPSSIADDVEKGDNDIGYDGTVSGGSEEVTLEEGDGCIVSFCLCGLHPSYRPSGWSMLNWLL